MYMSPDQYRGKLKHAKECLEKAKEVVSGRTASGLTMPILFLDDIQSNISEVNKTIGSLKECISGLKSSSKRSQYESVMIEMVQCELELESVLKKFMK